jgi:hypothetical protein
MKRQHDRVFSATRSLRAGGQQERRDFFHRLGLEDRHSSLATLYDSDALTRVREFYDPALFLAVMEKDHSVASLDQLIMARAACSSGFA